VGWTHDRHTGVDIAVTCVYSLRMGLICQVCFPLLMLLCMQEVCLSTSGRPDAVAAHDSCLAWPPLPVRYLSLPSLFTTERVLQQVAKLTHLTYLYMDVSEGSSGTDRGLCSALQPLQQLRTLHIDGCRQLQRSTTPGSQPGQWRGCGTPLCGMQQLSSLHLDGLDFTRADMTPLTHAKQLVSLKLSDCSIDDYGLGVIAAHLTGEGWYVYAGTASHVHRAAQAVHVYCIQVGSDG
jgi:hypothetical protein